MDCRYRSEGDNFSEPFGGCQILRSALYMWLVHRILVHRFSGLNFQQFYALPTQCIYVFCVDLRTNSDYFPIQH